MGRPVAYFEIVSNDAERVRKFYSELFEWTAEADPGMGGYALVDTGNGDTAVGGGIGPSSADDGPGVRISMRGDALDGYLERAEKLGGTRLVPPMDLPSGYGRIAMFADPDGNRVGLWS